MKVIFKECCDAQANFGGERDPRDFLTLGKTYELESREVHSSHTLYYLNGYTYGFNCACFEEYVEPIEQLKPKASNFIQWKGTDVCMDFKCECGAHLHIDGMFGYYIKCSHCETVYKLGSSVSIEKCSETPDTDAVLIGIDDDMAMGKILEDTDAGEGTKTYQVELSQDCPYNEAKLLQAKLDEITKYCEPHKEVMWAARVMGIIQDCDFRDVIAKGRD